MVQAHLFHPTLSFEIRYSSPALLQQHSTNPNGGPLETKLGLREYQAQQLTPRRRETKAAQF